MNPGKILIVEDEFIISGAIQSALNKQGYSCLAVNTGEEAISSLNNFNPDLILMDIGLAGKLDGLSTAAIIRHTRSLPIVYISEQDNSSVFAVAKETNPTNYITKPFSDGELLRAVELALTNIVMRENEASPAPMRDRVDDGIFIFYKDEYIKLLFADILYLKAERMNTFIYCTREREYKIALSSNHVVLQMAWPALVKTNKSTYVNIHKVESIRNDELRIQNRIITLSKIYRDDFLSRIKKIRQQ
ncbi:MAG: response regulator [Bacteroidetes bacterium]|nr:response regulator [Bacteroidota bacterium]